jgi:hypothetical protein
MAEQPSYVSNNIFVEMGLANLAEEQKLILLDQMNELVHKRAMLKVLETLNDQQKAELMAKKENSEQEQMEKLVELIPNLGVIILEEVEQVKNEIKASVSTQE